MTYKPPMLTARVVHVHGWTVRVEASGGWGTGHAVQTLWFTTVAELRAFRESALHDGRVQRYTWKKDHHVEAYCPEGHVLTAPGHAGCADCLGHRTWRCDECRATCYDPPPCKGAYWVP